MNDSHLRTTITPTLSFKAKFTTSFNSFDESSSDSIIMKINISHKVNRNIQHNKNEREFSHLNNCDDIISGSSRNNFDYWPIPDAVAVTIDHEEFVPRECIQTIIIKTKPLEYLNEEYLRSIKDKTISPLIDSIDRHFNLNILQKINLKIRDLGDMAKNSYLIRENMKIEKTTRPTQKFLMKYLLNFNMKEMRKKKFGIVGLFDSFQITDHNFIKHLSTMNLWTDQWILNPNFKDCKPLFFECTLEGDLKFKPFAVMKISRRQARSSIDAVSQSEMKKNTELLKYPFRADLIILPLNFVEFITLLRIREKIEIQSNKETYLSSWKVLLESYAHEIPNYYKVYLQAALNSMGYTEVSLLKKTKGEKMLSSKLHDIIKKFKEDQSNLSIDRERIYLINLRSHRHIVFGGFPDCCRNLRCFLPKTSLKLQAKLQQVRNKSNLSLSDPFSFDRKNIILTVSSIAKDFNCKLSLEPKPDINTLDINQELLDQEKDLKKKLIAEDDHEKPIFCMGNVQAFRDYPVLKSINLTDKEFKIYTDISFGNLFTTAIKSKYHTAQAHNIVSDLVDDSEKQEVESVFIFEAEKCHLRNKLIKLQAILSGTNIENDASISSEKEFNLENSQQSTSEVQSAKSTEEKVVEAKNELKEDIKKELTDQNMSQTKVNDSAITPKKNRKIVDINYLINKFFKENCELTQRIHYEILEIAGSYPLQQKMLNCGLNSTLQIETKESERTICLFWPIFREIKPKIIRKFIINRALKRLASFNINS